MTKMINEITVMVIAEALKEKREGETKKPVIELCGDIIDQKVHSDVQSEVMDKCLLWLVGSLPEYFEQESRFPNG